MATWTHYNAKVYGTIFDGSPAHTEYRFESEPTRLDVINRAGDFSKIKRIELRRTDTTITRLTIRAVEPGNAVKS